MPAGKFTLLSYENNVKVGTITNILSYCPANAGPTLIAYVKGSVLDRINYKHHVTQREKRGIIAYQGKKRADQPAYTRSPIVTSPCFRQLLVRRFSLGFFFSKCKPLFVIDNILSGTICRFSVFVLCFQIFTVQLFLRPKMDLTFAISIAM